MDADDADDDRVATLRAFEVWIDARACGAGVVPIAPDFDLHYLA